MQEIFDVLTRLRQAEEPCALATVGETLGSVSARTGSKAVEEIALSMLSKVVMHRRGASGAILRDKTALGTTAHTIADAAA